MAAKKQGAKGKAPKAGKFFPHSNIRRTTKITAKKRAKGAKGRKGGAGARGGGGGGG
jgi:hypothetical protein